MSPKPCDTIPKECVINWLNSKQSCRYCETFVRYEALIMLGWLFFGVWYKK